MSPATLVYTDEYAIYNRYVGGNFDEREGSSAPLVEGAIAVVTVKDGTV
ncbi:MAG: hypothetical protein AB4050_18765 [Synechococcus sp.]